MLVRLLILAMVPCFLAACDDGSPHAASAAPAPVASPASQPSTKPATRVRVPAFRQDGVYTASIDGKDTQVVVATGDRAAIAAFLQSLKTELLREYRGGDGAIAEMLKLHAAEKNPPFAGAAIVLTGQQDKRSGKLYFLGKRNYVEINDRLTRRVTYTRGVKTTFDPPVQISYFLFEVSQWDDDEDKITADMTAGDLSFAVRSDALTAARPCMLFDHKEFMVLDKATPAADARP